MSQQTRVSRKGGLYLKTKLDKLIDGYRNAVNNNNEKRIEELICFFRQIGIEPFGLDIIAFI